MDPNKVIDRRRHFLKSMLTGASFSAALPAVASAQPHRSTEPHLPWYVREQSYQSLKQSTYDRSGGNADSRKIAPGSDLTVFEAEGPGTVTHIWFTIAAKSSNHLKELVIRAYWDGNAKPSVETPVGDFFGLNVGEYAIYESAFLACSPGKSLNCYFAMPYRKSAKITITNQGTQAVDAFYSNIDYQTLPELPQDVLYFHAHYRQSAPCSPVKTSGPEINLDGKNNYVFGETQGSGHLMGVTLGVQQNGENWFGEGDEMIFIDDRSKPAITGTGTEDYFLGSWDFGGRDGAIPFAHHFYGAPLIALAERTGGRYCMYRWHGDNPVTFRSYMKHTIEHGHANDRGDNFYSVCYWYQNGVSEELPELPPVNDRILKIHNNA
jgi:hypothetical protein